MDGGIALGHVGHEMGEALVAGFALGEVYAWSVGMNDDERDDAGGVAAFDEVVPLGEDFGVVLAWRGGVFHLAPIEGDADEADIGGADLLDGHVVELMRADAYFGAGVVDPELGGAAAIDADVGVGEALVGDGGRVGGEGGGLEEDCQEEEMLHGRY